MDPHDAVLWYGIPIRFLFYIDLLYRDTALTLDSHPPYRPMPHLELRNRPGRQDIRAHRRACSRRSLHVRFSLTHRHALPASAPSSLRLRIDYTDSTSFTARERTGSSAAAMTSRCVSTTTTRPRRLRASRLTPTTSVLWPSTRQFYSILVLNRYMERISNTAVCVGPNRLSSPPVMT